MTPDALHRLLADLPAPDPPHPVDAGLLGEYALVARTRDRAAVAAEAYPAVVAHLRGGCERCRAWLAELEALARRTGPASGRARPAPVPAATPPGRIGEAAAASDVAPRPEPLEIAEAAALARAVEAEREALRAPPRSEHSEPADTRRRSARRRQVLLVEAALIRQRLLVRRLFLQRARSLAAAPSATVAPWGSGPMAQVPSVRGPFAPRAGHTVGPERDRGGRTSRQPNPKARLLLDDFASGVDELARLSGRIGRLTVDLRRLGDDPRGPARSQSEALADRGLAMTREALALDRRLARLQGPLAGMVT